MHRLLRWGLASLLLACGVAVLVLTSRLPPRVQVRAGFENATAIAHNAESEVRLLRRQLSELPRDEMLRAAEQLRLEAAELQRRLESQQIDYVRIAAIGMALREVADGTRQSHHALQTQRGNLKDVATGVRAGSKVASQVADEFANWATRTYPSGIRFDGLTPRVVMSPLFPGGPTLVANTREVAQGLDKAAEGLDATHGNLPAVLQSLQGAALMLDTAAEQVDQLVARKDELERTIARSAEFSASLQRLLPRLAVALESNLDEQDRLLAAFEQEFATTQQLLAAQQQPLSESIEALRIFGYLLAGLAFLLTASSVIRPAPVASA